MTAAPPVAGAALAALLGSPTTCRTADDYESTFDDFIRFAGGSRIIDYFPPPTGVLNADYHLTGETWELVLELKQMATYRPQQTVDAYFNERLAKGKIQNPAWIANNKVQIDRTSLSASEWRRFYKSFRPSVGRHLDKAAQQLRATDGFLPPPAEGVRRVFGVVLLNSNDFGVSTDLLHRLAEWKVRDAWGLGRFRCLDFVTCLSMDMLDEERNPLHGRHFVRNNQDADLVSAVWALYDRWVRYGAAAIGAEVQFRPGPVADEVRVDTHIRGKIRMLTSSASDGRVE